MFRTGTPFVLLTCSSPCWRTTGKTSWYLFDASRLYSAVNEVHFPATNIIFHQSLAARFSDPSSDFLGQGFGCFLASDFFLELRDAVSVRTKILASLGSSPWAPVYHRQWPSIVTLETDSCTHVCMAAKGTFHACNQPALLSIEEENKLPLDLQQAFDLQRNHHNYDDQSVTFLPKTQNHLMTFP